MWKDDALDCKVAVGEVLVSRSNTQERVGRASMYMGDPPDVVSSDLTIRIWPQQVTSAFLTRYLSYLYLTGYWEERSGGASSTMKKITRQQVLAVRVPVPSAETQRSITTALDDRMDSIASLQGALATEKHAIEALIPGLMGRAFRGEL
jgi:type I restriction enzyme S subunit